MTQYSKLIQAYDPEKDLLLILTPQLVEIMYTAKTGGPEYLDPLDSWVDQFLNHYVSHGNITPCRANSEYTLGVMAKILDNDHVSHSASKLFDGPLYK